MDGAYADDSRIVEGETRGIFSIQKKKFLAKTMKRFHCGISIRRNLWNIYLVCRK